MSVVYVGRLHATGKRFDHCSNPNKPFQFVLGAQSVVDGFDRAVVGMRVGGVRQVIVPPNLAYGDEGAKPKILRAPCSCSRSGCSTSRTRPPRSKEAEARARREEGRPQGAAPGGSPRAGQRKKRQVR